MKANSYDASGIKPSSITHYLDSLGKFPKFGVSASEQK